MRYRLRTLLIVLAIGPHLCAQRPANCETPKQPQAKAAARHVSIRILGPADEITGMQLPGGLETKSDSYFRVDGPTQVSLAIPDFPAVDVEVKYVSVNVDHGIAVDVHLLPQSEAVSFRQ